MKAERKILVGVILGAHGVQGAVRLRSFAAEPESLFAFKVLTGEDGTRAFAPKLKGVMKDHFIASLKGVTDRSAAEALKGVKLFVDRSALPETSPHEYYEADLIGFAARDENKKDIGKVEAVHDFGAGAFVEIRPAKGASFMLPFNGDYVPDVDMKNGCLTVVVPDGWRESGKPPVKGKRKK
jgi:16S rRNA processing protein RimM